LINIWKNPEISKKNKNYLIYIDNKFLNNSKITIFTASSSGTGKTEHTTNRIEKEDFYFMLTKYKQRIL